MCGMLATHAIRARKLSTTLQLLLKYYSLLTVAISLPWSIKGNHMTICSAAVQDKDVVCRFLCRQRLGYRADKNAEYLAPVPAGSVVYGSGETAVVLSKVSNNNCVAFAMSVSDAGVLLPFHIISRLDSPNIVVNKCMSCSCVNVSHAKPSWWRCSIGICGVLMTSQWLDSLVFFNQQLVMDSTNRF